MATATKVAQGDTIPHTPSSAVSAGDVVVLSELIGVATEDIAADQKGSLAVEGIFEFPRVAATAMDAGDIAYWDVADQEVNTDNTNPVLGKVSEDSASGASVVRVKLTH